MEKSWVSLLLIVIVILTVRTILAWRGPTMNVQELNENWVAAKPAKDVRLIDVRQPEEFAEGRVPGAVNLPLGELDRSFDALATAQTIYVICRSGARSAVACEKLSKRFPEKRVVNVAGGTGAWIGAGLPVEKN